MKTKLIIAAMLAAAGLAGAQMFAQLFGGKSWTPAALNPIAWWSFESAPGDVVSDAIASKAMTLIGSPTISAGLRGNAITTASGKYGSFTAFSSATNFSFNVWLKTGSPTSDMVFLGNSASNIKLLEKLTATLSCVRFGGAAPIYFTIPSFGTNWRMYTVTCAGTSTRVYIDGAESVSGVQIVADANINSFNQVGRFSTSGSFFWNGQIDELTVYNYTLSQAQITQLYNYR